MSLKTQRFIGKAFGYLGLLLLIVFIGLPVFWLVIGAFKANKEILTANPQFLPASFQFDNFTKAWTGAKFSSYYINSIATTLMGATAEIVMAVTTAYALVFIRFPFRNAVFILLLIALMVPEQVVIVPNFLTIANMELPRPSIAGILMSIPVNLSVAFIVKRTGSAERAAILLLSLGEKEAAEVLKHLSAKDVQKVGTAMTQVTNVSRPEVIDVLAAFTSEVEAQTSLGLGNDEFIRKTLINALGEDKAGGLIDRILLGRSSKGLEALKWMDASAIAEMVRLEHPQIAAIILSYLEPDQSAEVIAMLPENMRSELLLRVATLDGVQPAALQELDQIMERQFSGSNQTRKSVLGGPKVVANIINMLEPRIESVVMQEITAADEQLGGKIQDLIFVFDNLIEVDDRGMQELLRQVTSDKLLLALKAADDALKEKIFKNMSQRAAEMLREDLASRGPVKLSEVEGAQKEILVIARKLAEEGSINLGSKGGGEAYV